MSIVARKRKRLAILLAGIVVLTAGGVGAWFWRQARNDRRALDAGVAGRAAVEKGDHMGVLNGLGQYLGRFGDEAGTADDWYHYGMARFAVEQINDRHLMTAAASLRKALQRDPEHIDARSALIDLFMKMQFTAEAMAEVDVVLKARPDDAAALKTRTILLARSSDLEGALESAFRLNESAPDDLEGFFATLSLMIRLSRPHAEIHEWAEGLHRERPDDRRIKLLRASVYRTFGDRTLATGCLEEALEGPPLDPVFTAALIRELDRAEMFADALATLRTIEFADLPLRLRRELAVRLWFANARKELADTLAKADPALYEEDVDIVALQLMALRALGRTDEIGPARARLDTLRPDSNAEAWVVFIDQVVNASDPDMHAAVAACKASLDLHRDNPIVLHRLGDAYKALGEDELALVEWSNASRQAFTWSSPLTRIASLLLLSGREHLALAPAKRAFVLAPNDQAALSTWIEAMVKNAGRMPPERIHDLLESLTDYHRENPQNEQTLPVYVALLAERDPQQASRQMDSILMAEVPPSERTLLRLAAAIEDSGLHRADACFALSERVHGLTARLAFARANHLLREGERDAALESLRADRERAGGDSAEWSLAWVRLLDMLNDERAPALWVETADGHPENLQVQLATIASHHAWDDLAAMERTISRTKRLTGDDGLTWRVAQARLLLLVPDGGAEKAEAASEILTEVVRRAPASLPVRLLLAMARERLGDLSGAMEQVNVATTLAPEEGSLTLELARLAQERGDTDAAKSTLDRFLRREATDPREVQRVAVLLFRQGRVRRAVRVIEDVRKRRPLVRGEALLLARLYSRAGQHARALAMCERLLREPDPQAIALAAQMYAEGGRESDARAVLKGLDELDMPAEERHLVRAEFYSATGDAAQALEHFRAAVDAKPDSDAVWIALLAHCVRTGDVGAARAQLSADASGGGSAMRVVRKNAGAFLAALPDAQLRPLLFSLLQDPGSRGPVLEVLQLLLDQPDPQQAEAGLLQAVGELAAKNPRVLPLQVVAADVLGRAGRFEDGLKIAKHAMDAFPVAAAPAQQAAQLYATLGRWSEAMDAAQKWRERQTRKDRNADLLVAEVLVRLGRPADAARELEPHVEDARAHPDENERLLLSYSWALLLSGRESEATDLLLPLAAMSDRWRRLWMGFDVQALTDTRTAVLWLNTATRLIPSDDLDGSMAIAQAWRWLWRKTKDPRHFQAAEKRLVELARHRPEAAEALGMLNHDAGRFDIALQVYLDALARDDSLLLSRNNAAMILARKGDKARSVELAEALCERDPENAEFLDTLGFCYAEAERPADAATAYGRAASAEPGNPARHVVHALALETAGEDDGAREAVRRADELLADGAKLSEDKRKELAQLRGSLLDSESRMTSGPK